MSVASGPDSGEAQIGGVPAPAQRVPYPPLFLGRSNGRLVSVVPEGTKIEIDGAPCVGAT